MNQKLQSLVSLRKITALCETLTTVRLQVAERAQTGLMEMDKPGLLDSCPKLQNCPLPKQRGLNEEEANVEVEENDDQQEKHVLVLTGAACP